MRRAIDVCGAVSYKTEPGPFLEELRSRKRANNNQPQGTFGLFYESLIAEPVVVSKELQFPGTDYTRQVDMIHMQCWSYSFQQLPNEFCALDLVRTLPDMYDLLDTVGIQPLLIPGGVSRHLITGRTRSQGKTIKLIKETTSYFIEKADPRARCLFDYYIKLLEREKESHEKAEPPFRVELVPDAFGFFLERTYAVEMPNPIMWYPRLTDSVSGQLFFAVDPENRIPETASYFIILYSLGMLCRYSPDIWARTVDNCAATAEIIDSFLDIAYRKFPQLILDQLSFTKHVFHA